MSTMKTLIIRPADVSLNPLGDGSSTADATVSVVYDRDVWVGGQPVPRAPLISTSIPTAGLRVPVLASDDPSITEGAGFVIKVVLETAPRIGQHNDTGTRLARTIQVVTADPDEIPLGSKSNLTVVPDPAQYADVMSAITAAAEAKAAAAQVKTSADGMVADVAASKEAATQTAADLAATKQLAASMVGPTDAGVAQLTQSGPSTRAALRAFADTAARSASTASTLRATTDKVGISVVSSTRWRLRAQVAANQVWSQDLALLPAGSYVGPSQPPMLLDAATLAVTSPAPPNTLGTPTWVDETDASVTHTGTTYQWQNVTADSRAYGGGYRFTLTAGEYVNWTTPAGTVHVVASVVANINGGYGLVEIDGSKTAATSLPTAQDEVTAGRLTSTALVANGGTLNPTDRLLNFYSASSLWDDRRVLATGLATGAHTVRITCTGYKQGTAAAARIFSSGFGAAGYAATGTPTTTTTTLFPQGSAYSAYEYAIDVESADGSQHDFVGNVHGYDKPSSVTVYVDGAPVDMTQVGADYSGSDVTIIRDSTISSPYLTGDVATARVMYRLTRDGLEVRTRLTFAQACKLRGGYTAMYPVADALKRGVIVGQPGVLDLSKGTGGAAGGVRAYSQAAYVYDPASGVTACMWLPDLSGVGTYAATSTTQGGMFIEDRTGNVINKIYASFVSPDVKRSVAAGEVITGRTIYRAMQLPDPTMLNPAGGV